MASVKGPLFSIGASGSIGGAIVYSVWKGRAYVRQHAVPSNPKAVGQLSMRAMLKFLTQAWADLSANEQADWETRAAVTNISPFNAYVSYNMKRWGTDLKPSKLDPATADATPGTISVFSATAAVRSILISVTVSSHDNNWGILIYRKLTDDLGLVRNELVQVIPAEATATFTWLDFPLTPGIKQHYRCYPFDATGLIGSAEDSVNATPTT